MRNKRITVTLLAAAITLGISAAMPLTAIAAGPAPAAEAPLSGWQQERNSWYYYIEGIKQTGWIEYNKKDYFLKSDGAMATGWVTWSNNKYYMDAEGVMVTGWQQIGNKWYYFYESGSMATGWLEYKKDWFYLNKDGSMVTGWITIGNGKYYFNPDGTMVTGWSNMDNKWYYFLPSGEMISNGWLSDDGYWYFFKRDGVMAAREWLRIEGVWYHFAATGMMYSATGDGSYRLTAAQASFVDRFQGHAAALSVNYGIPWEAVMAQGILESASGTSNFARNRNNFFGIGAVDSNPNNAYYYDSPEAGWEGYFRFIRDNGRYARNGVFRGATINDPYAYIRAVKAAGYATDPNYVAKLTPLVSGILHRAYQAGWATSVELDLAYPQMRQAAAKNAS